MEPKAKREERVDRISDLPDALVCHILSFLPTMYAVCTTVLSKRWKNLWVSVPNLDFDFDDLATDDDGVPTSRFMKFVERALYLRGTLDMHKFHLRCITCQNLSDKDLSRIGSWIRTAIKRNVVELDLQLCFEYGRFLDDYKLPPSLYMCRTLLKLSVFSDCITYTPPKGCFPSLKVLSVTLFQPGDYSIEKLFSCCPVLEDLTIELNLRSHRVVNVSISAPELKTLRIWLSCVYYCHRNNFYINAPKLEHLDLSDNLLSNCFLDSTKYVVRGEVQFTGRHEYEGFGLAHEDDEFSDKDSECSNHATPSLAKFLNVRHLSLSGEPYRLEACSLPAFDNLSRLELVLFDGYYWELLTEFLNKSPNLEYLVLENMDMATEDLSDHPQPGWNPPEFVPACLSSHLKTISIRRFMGRRDEMEAAKYLLQNGEGLKTMTIYLGKNIPRNEWYEKQKLVCKELYAFPWASKNCQVNII